MAPRERGHMFLLLHRLPRSILGPRRPHSLSPRAEATGVSFAVDSFISLFVNKGCHLKDIEKLHAPCVTSLSSTLTAGPAFPPFQTPTSVVVRHPSSFWGDAPSHPTRAFSGPRSLRRCEHIREGYMLARDPRRRVRGIFLRELGPPIRVTPHSLRQPRYHWYHWSRQQGPQC